MATINTVNTLLNDKLYQVVGSTPASIAESLRKVNIAGNKEAGAQLFAVSLFAAAVNKATLETFVSDSRFAAVRPLINAALSISGKSNMTALTLLGHCFLTTESASEVKFAVEFRRKMGQNNLWSGELESGSLSETQKKILKEKKKVTVESEARALGNGFLKFCNLINDPLTDLELNYFGTGASITNVVTQGSSGTAMVASTSIASGAGSPENFRSVPPPVPAPVAKNKDALSTASRAGSSTAVATPSRTSSRPTSISNVTEAAFTKSDSTVVMIPVDVLAYRRDIIKQSDSDIESSLDRQGVASFTENTRRLKADDPTGERSRSAQTTVAR